MKKTIIIPTDFSDNARKAYHYAFSLFGFEEVHYILLNTYDLPYTRMEVMIDLKEELANYSKEGLDAELTYCQIEYRDVDMNITLRSEFGRLANELETVANEVRPDFIVLGTKGASGIESVLIGSNAASVIQSVEYPTIAVPNKAKFKLPKRIALAMDFEKISDSILESLGYIATISDAKLLFFNIEKVGNADDFKSITNENYSHPALGGITQSMTTMQEADVTDGIEEFVDDHEVDLLTMVVRKHNFFESIFHRSVTKKMVMEMEDIPLLLLHG